MAYESSRLSSPSPERKIEISFKQFILCRGTFIKSALIFLCFFFISTKKKYMADIGIIEESRPLV